MSVVIFVGFECELKIRSDFSLSQKKLISSHNRHAVERYSAGAVVS